jgi:hypothetical protein
MPLTHNLSEGEMNELENSQLPSIRQNLAKRSVGRKKLNKPEDCQVPSLRQNIITRSQNIITRSLGKTKAYKQQNSQLPSVRQHKELERWKTQGPIWGYSEIYLQRMCFQVFRFFLGSQTFFSFLWQLGGFLVEAERN